MHRIVLVIDKKVVVELNAVKEIDDAHLATCLSYLKATNRPIELSFDPDLIKKVAVAGGLTFAEPLPEPNTAALTRNACLSLTRNHDHESCPIPEQENQPDRSGNGFTFVTTGDNNSSDCQHRGFQFKVKVKYVIPAIEQ